MKTKTGKIGNGHAKVAMPSISKHLASPTDLATADVEAISQCLNVLIADAFALYVKTKNYHWHLSGVHFRDLHLLFDEQAEAILTSIDLLAERVRRIGCTTLRSVGHVSKLQTIADDDEKFVSPLEMVRRLRTDNQKMVEAQRAAHDLCDESRDAGTAGILETLIDETERRVWFLFEVQQSLEVE